MLTYVRGSMDQSTVQLITAIAGFAATLGGVLITQYFNRRSESSRRRYETESRWHEENYRVSASIVTKATAIERSLYSAASVLDDEEREPRMPGCKTILLSPEDGIDGLFDEVIREILVEAVEDGFTVIEEIDDLAGELEIIGSPEQTVATRLLTDQILDAVGELEMFTRSSDAYLAILAIREARAAFADASRRSLVGLQRGRPVRLRPKGRGQPPRVDASRPEGS